MDNTLAALETTWRQLGDNFGINVGQLWHIKETSLGQLWDIFELRQLSDKCDTTLSNFDTTLRQLLHNFDTALTNLETTLVKLWHNFKTILGLLRENFETTLVELWDHIVIIIDDWRGVAGEQVGLGKKIKIYCRRLCRKAAAVSSRALLR